MTYQTDKQDPFSASVASVDEAIYGTYDVGLSGRVVAKPTDVKSIYADPAQPRRAIPANIRGHWNGNPDDVVKMLDAWAKRVEKSLSEGERLDWRGILKTEDYIDAKPEALTQEAGAFLALIDLAMNIRDKGLNNPITITRRNDQIYIHTGERRWLAHVMLNACGLGFEKIAAIERPFDVWTQISENTQRLDMNAISMARSYALLQMEMHKDSETFKAYDLCENDLAFYAQARKLRIPSGQSESVLNALGKSSRGYLSNYKRLLDLTLDEWLLADQMNTPESRLREVLNLPEALRYDAILYSWSLDVIRDAIRNEESQNIPFEAQKQAKSVNNVHDREQFSDFGGDLPDETQSMKRFIEGVSSLVNGRMNALKWEQARIDLWRLLPEDAQRTSLANNWSIEFMRDALQANEARANEAAPVPVSPVVSAPARERAHVDDLDDELVLNDGSLTYSAMMILAEGSQYNGWGEAGELLALYAQFSESSWLAFVGRFASANELSDQMEQDLIVITRYIDAIRSSIQAHFDHLYNIARG